MVRSGIASVIKLVLWKISFFYNSILHGKYRTGIMHTRNLVYMETGGTDFSKKSSLKLLDKILDTAYSYITAVEPAVQTAHKVRTPKRWLTNKRQVIDLIHIAVSISVLY